MKLTFVGCGDAFGSGGRLNTCFHLHDDGSAGAPMSWLVDCGASSYVGLNRLGIDIATISTLLITHFHGDHFGGVPFLILDGLFRNPRKMPLTIIGPVGVEDRVIGLMETIFPGYLSRPRDFEIRFVEILPGAPLVHEGVSITAFLVVHDASCGPCHGYRLEGRGRIVAFSGDTTWCDALPPLAKGADVFVCECSSIDANIPVHLNYVTLRAHLAELETGTVILTHMQDDMLAAGDEIAEVRAYDGLTVAVGATVASLDSARVACR